MKELEDLITAIEANIEDTVNVYGDMVPIVPIQYISEELEMARALLRTKSTNTYKIYQNRTECFYQEVEANSLEEAIEMSDYCDSELIPVDGTGYFEIDEESTLYYNKN